MGQRRWGWALVLGAFLIVVVLSGTGGRVRGGVPFAASVAGAPIVGDCLVQDPADVQRVDVLGADGLAAPEIGPCSRSHFGEMVLVVADGSTFPRSIVDRLSIPDLGFCAQAVEKYLGLSQRPSRGTPGQTDVGFHLWYPVQQGLVRLTGPSPRQQQLGQHWVGCALYADGNPYDQSARQAFLNGRMPTAFSLCRNTIGESATVDCAAAHRVELFGAATLTGTQINHADLDLSCRSMLRTLTGMSDPTAGNRLTAAATLFHTDSAGTRRPGPPILQGDTSAAATCSLSVTGQGYLQGTLFGLNEHPLPLH